LSWDSSWEEDSGAEPLSVGVAKKHVARASPSRWFLLAPLDGKVLRAQNPARRLGLPGVPPPRFDCIGLVGVHISRVISVVLDQPGDSEMHRIVWRAGGRNRVNWSLVQILCSL